MAFLHVWQFFFQCQCNTATACVPMSRMCLICAILGILITKSTNSSVSGRGISTPGSTWSTRFLEISLRWCIAGFIVGQSRAGFFKAYLFIRCKVIAFHQTNQGKVTKQQLRFPFSVYPSQLTLTNFDYLKSITVQDWFNGVAIHAHVVKIEMYLTTSSGSSVTGSKSRSFQIHCETAEALPL